MFSENNQPEWPFSVLGSYGQEPKWGWRTVIDRKSDDEITITMSNIEPGGKDEKAVEMAYVREQ